MDRSWLARVAGNLALAGFFSAAPAGAQSLAPSTSPSSSPPVWTAAAGYESFWLRDVARSGRPVDASPMEWRGDGPALIATYDRERPGRVHHFDASIALARGFSLHSPVRTLDAPDGDRARRLGARYEYRRYPFRNVGLLGLDLGIGAGADVEQLVFLRHFAPAIDLRSAVLNFGTSAVIAARLNRSRLDLLATFGNGLSIGRGTSRHRGEVETKLDGWGGGWQTHLGVHAAVRVHGRTAIVVSYLNSGEGRFASHDSITFGRSRFTVGAMYER